MGSTRDTHRPVISFDFARRSARRAGAPAAQLRDPLTGALTRQAFFDALGEQGRLADRHGRSFSLCVIDVDRLRNINAEHGQRLGDEVLRRLTGRLLETLANRPWNQAMHVIGRFDGGALALLTPSFDSRRGACLMEDLRASLRNRPLVPSAEVTISAGVSQHRVGEIAERALVRAEAALHLAKQFGRDCIELASSAGRNSAPAHPRRVPKVASFPSR
jgi:diguanylate cyclase (GGDEF)-like protein